MERCNHNKIMKLFRVNNLKLILSQQKDGIVV